MAIRRQIMDETPNPIYAKGNKNVFCPYYIKCLDRAVMKKWNYFSCGGCPHEAEREKITISGDHGGGIHSFFRIRDLSDEEI